MNENKLTDREYNLFLLIFKLGLIQYSQIEEAFNYSKEELIELCSKFAIKLNIIE